MAIEEGTVTANGEHGAIESRLSLGVAFVDTDHDVRIGTFGSFAERRDFRPIKMHPILEQLARRRPPRIGERAIDEKRIAWQPSFPKCNYVWTFFGRLIDPIERDLEASVFIEQGGRGLDGA